MDLSRLRGIFPPTVTPLTADERVDGPSLRRLLDFLLEGGVHGIWAMGTTGEFAMLTEDERARGVKITVDQVAGRVPVVANVGDGSTALALRHARRAAAAGADALALTPPYYYPHSMDEMLVHFRVLKQALPDLPLLVYNIPSTVKVKMTIPTIVELAREGTVEGIKDSQNDVQFLRQMVVAVTQAGLQDRFRMFAGTRTLIDASMVVGVHGAIPATSNIVPAQCVAAYDAAERGDYRAARQAQEQVLAAEGLAQVARDGSANAATMSTLKHVLHLWGIVDNPILGQPLRNLASEEVEELKRRLAQLPDVRQPAASAR